MLSYFQKRIDAYKMSLRKQTLHLFVTILCLLVFLFLMTSLFISKKANDEYRMRTSETAVNNVSSTICSYIENYNYISRLIMVNDRVISFLHAETANKSISYEARMGIYEILNMANNINLIDSVYIFRNDKAYAYSGKGRYIIHHESEEWNRILAAKGSRVISINGNGMMEKADNSSFLTLARAIYDLNTQKQIGYLVMNISTTKFDDILKLQKSSDSCVVNEDGEFLCGNPDLVELYDASFRSEEIVKRKVRFHGKQAVLMGKDTQESLIVLCCTSIKRNGVAKDTLLELMVLFTFLFLSVLVCAWFIRSQITRPMLALYDAMEKTKSAGWLEPITEPMPENEIGQLAESYNTMIDYLKELFDKIIKDEENIRRAELRVLHEQIKPHFLYNTLGTISYLAVEEQADRTHEALETLGSFFRNFLSKGDREISFERELNIAKDYLSLQKLRYGTSFEDEYEIEQEALPIKVPKLILQPLVENSIYHGVRLKGELCKIRITAKVLEDGLHIIVYDTGVGMSEEQIALQLAKKQDNQSSGGFGLSGTIERLRYYCNREDVVTICSEEGEFTQIEILIPLHKDRNLEKEYGKERYHVQSHDN